MSAGFLIAFGGPILLGLIGAILALYVTRRRPPSSADTPKSGPTTDGGPARLPLGRSMKPIGRTQ